jgi:hypothetical protein
MKQSSTPFPSFGGRSWSGLRLLLVPVLLLVLGHQNLEGLHALVEPHSYCDVHAQVEHVLDSDRDALGASEAVGQKHPVEERESPQLADSPDGHNACEVALIAPGEEFVLDLSRILSRGTRELPLRETTALSPEFRPRELRFRLAPKNSPPTA